MNLDDLQQPRTTAAMAKLLSKHYGVSVPVDKLTTKTAQQMLETIQKKLNRFRNSKSSHLAEKNQNYTVLMLTEQLLTQKLNEISQYTKAQRALGQKGFWGQVSQGTADAATAVGGALKNIPGAQVQSPVSQRNIKDLATTVKNLATAFRTNAKNEFAKTLANSDMSENEFNQLLKKAEQNQLSPAEFAEFKSIIDDIEWSARKINDSNINQLTRTMKTLMSKISPEQSKTIKENRMRYQQIKSKKKIVESAMADAEVVLAAKDIADRFQDMVETLGKMVNEELPALTETIRDTMGAEQADAYNASAIETINAALETIRGSKDSLDSAARTLAGEEQPANTIDQEFVEPGAEELDQIPPVASGDDQEPLGRGKR